MIRSCGACMTAVSLTREGVCPHSMYTLLKKAARAWQWRCVAFHEGYESLDRGAVVAPLSRRAVQPTVKYPRAGLLTLGRR